MKDDSNVSASQGAEGQREKEQVHSHLMGNTRKRRKNLLQSCC